MFEPSRNKHSGHGNGRKISLMEVSSRDAVTFTAKLLIIMTWLMMITIGVSIAAGGRKPKESPVEIALGMAFITVALLMVIVIRRKSIARSLSTWSPVRAEIFHSAHVQFFITVGLLYSWRDKEFKRTVQVPAGKATKFLVDRKEVTLLVDPDNPRRVVIGEIYGRGEDAVLS
jgi:hypothetical protein